MPLKEWANLPKFMRNDAVRPFYDILAKHKYQLIGKRVFDLIVGLLILVITFPLMVVIGIIIKLDSKGPVIFRQIRITQYGKEFRIMKFRTMVENMGKQEILLTAKGDTRITRVGRVLRRLKIDELPQLFNIIEGNMSFVGTRPEVKKYVDAYSEEMKATLLLPAGVTSTAAILYKDEEKLIANCHDIDKIYIEIILPDKMKYNLRYLAYAGLGYDLSLMWKTMLLFLRRCLHFFEIKQSI
jgi:lipopolysaccharide/colanic/teichoic acid biosynthesis glycosyltransferase